MFIMKNFAPFSFPRGLSIGDWLRVEREKRGWSQSDLGRATGLGRSLINKLENADQNTTLYNCINIARAFDMPPEDLMRIAGILPQKPNDNPLENKIKYLISKLPTEEDKEDVLAYVELRHRRAEDRVRYETGKGSKSTRT
jgi:transcriptional regulator with XRE-family HTH domain